MGAKPYSPKKRLTFLQAAAILGVVVILIEAFKGPELEKRIRKFERSGGY